MEDKINKIKKLIARLRDGIAIVEGKKDVNSLKKIGVKSLTYRKIHMLNTKKEIFILTDLDEEGERLLKEINYELMLKGFKPNVVMRKKLAYLLSVRRFEEIADKLAKIEVKVWEKLT